MKILFLVTEDWYFWSHRLSLARAVRDKGAEVLVMTRVVHLEGALKREGFTVIPWHIKRGSLNPFREFYAFVQVFAAYRRTRPNLVHHIALKPIVYGGLAALLCRDIPSVNTVAGLGHVFTSESRRMYILRRVLIILFRRVLKRKSAMTAFQNNENRDFLVETGVVSEEQTVVIKGSGVNVREFTPRPEPKGIPVVLMASRMLWEKGVGEFVEAAKILRNQGVSACFVLVGESDPANPSSIPEAQLLAWENSGTVEWWRLRKDMPEVFAQANLVCFPSYLEGLPKVLIEAAACGRAIVTTAVPGCREVVRDGYNGLLVPARNANALAYALDTLLKDPVLRARMGALGREIAVRDFSEELVIEKSFAVYAELLGSRWPGAFATVIS